MFRGFTLSVGALFLVTSVAKLISATGHARILQNSDPLLGISFQHIFWLAGLVEFIVAMICFFAKHIWLQVGLVAWLSTNFVLYRFGLWLVGWHRPCSCLGNLTDALHLSPQIADTVMKIILAYLLIGSYATLFWLWRQRKKTVSRADGAASL